MTEENTKDWKLEAVRAIKEAGLAPLGLAYGFILGIFGTTIAGLDSDHIFSLLSDLFAARFVFWLGWSLAILQLPVFIFVTARRTAGLKSDISALSRLVGKRDEQLSNLKKQLDEALKQEDSSENRTDQIK